MERITFKNILFFGKHGAFDEERTLGQRFAIDLTFWFDAREAVINDDLEKTVDYETIFNEVHQIITKEKHKLIETLAHRVAMNVLENHRIIQEISVCIRKPNAPVNGIFDFIEVEVNRKNEDLLKSWE